MTGGEPVVGEDDRSALDELPALRAMPEDVRSLVSDAFEPISYEFGGVIVREGDDADAFYVLVSGTARVVKQTEHGEEVPLNVLHRGDSFGEMGLLGDSTRVATVRASGAVQALRLDRGMFNALTRRDPAVRASFERLAQFRSVQNFLRLYSEFDSLPVDGLAMIAESLEPLDVAASERVVRQGDPPGPMYVVEEGRLRIFTERDGARDDLEYLRKGDFFGELSVLQDAPRAATVEAVTPCRLLVLGADLFRDLLDRYPAFRQRVEERAAGRDFRRVARVPLDFADEILPAEVEAADKVGPAQVEAEGTPAMEEGVEQLEAEGPPPARRRHRRRLPHVYQLDEMDCGAACLGMITRYYGKAVSLPEIRDLVHTSTDGTSLLGIARGAEELGLAVRTVRASKDRLDRLPLPAVVHWEGNHWVVLYEIGERTVRVGDPASGIRRLSRSEFEEKWTGYTALFEPTPAFDLVRESKPSYAWLRPFLRPHRGTLAKAVVLALLAAGLELVIPIFTQVVVDDALPDSDRNLLFLIFGATIVVLLVIVAATILQRYILAFAAVRIDTETLDFVTGRLLGLPMSYFTTRRTGDIERRLAGLREVREFLIQSGVAALTAGAQLLAALALMFFYSWQLALVYVALVPFYALLMRYSAVRLRPAFDSLEESFAKYQSQQIDAIRGIETVKSLAAEEGFRRAMLERFSGLADRIFRTEFLVLSYQGAVQTVTFLSLALFLFFGGLLVIDNQLTLGEFVSFNALVALGNAPVLILLSLWDEFQYGRVLLDRLADVTDHEQEQEELKGRLRTVTSVEGAIRLTGLGFRYGGPESPPILEGIDLDVSPGRTVAIVGRSGSGKTTLVKLLAGLLEPTEGTIEIDHIDLRTLDYRSVRRQIGFVLQENYLFDETIARNIAFGEEPDPARVARAASIANAHEFVQRLPLRYETRIGDSGLKLSGGQAQRIAIARAVYHRPPILLLDEASSALDVESEQAVKRNLDELLRERTSFVIAHRLSTIRDADMIVVLERGRLVEHGTHDELMELRGLYYYLVSQQLQV
jgi:ABC-type bacteriocin/lantibiotic exporter with double-glycine peptidase domain/CRP-like cAMP-binding protein